MQDLSPEEEERLRRRLAELDQARNCLHLDGIDAEAAELNRRLESGMLSDDEKEAVRQRLAALEQERIQLQIDGLSEQEAELQRRLVSGTLSAEEAEALKKQLAALQRDQLDLKIDALNSELNRRLASGSLSAEEEEAIRQRLAALDQERMEAQLEALAAEDAELRRRLANGDLSDEEADAILARLAAIDGERSHLAMEMKEADEMELRRKVAAGGKLSAKEQKRLDQFEADRKRAYQDALRQEGQRRIDEMLAAAGPGDFLRAGGLAGRMVPGDEGGRHHCNSGSLPPLGGEDPATTGLLRMEESGRMPPLLIKDVSVRPPLHASRAQQGLYEFAKMDTRRRARLEEMRWAMGAMMVMGDVALLQDATQSGFDFAQSRDPMATSFDGAFSPVRATASLPPLSPNDDEEVRHIDMFHQNVETHQVKRRSKSPRPRSMSSSRARREVHTPAAGKMLSRVFRLRQLRALEAADALG